MTDTVHCSRRAVLAAAPALATAAMAGIISPAHAGPKDAGGSMTVLEPVTLELVLNIVATCSSPERMGPADASKDGIRNEIWPISADVEQWNYIVPQRTPISGMPSFLSLPPAMKSKLL